MTIQSIKKMKRPKKIIIDLTGPQGNAFVLLGIATKLAKELHMNVLPILDEMRGGDYDNLLEVFDKYFGNYATLYR